MKLIEPSVVSYDPVIFYERVPLSLLDYGRMLIGTFDPRDRKPIKHEYAGRIIYSKCIIDFEDTPPSLYSDGKMPSPMNLDFGDVQYQGVYVVEYTDSPTVFVCSVSHIIYKDNP